MAAPVPLIAVRGSSGLHLVHGHPVNTTYENFERDDGKQCRAARWSTDGQYLAWVNGQSLKVWCAKTCKVMHSVGRPQIRCLEFSPRSTYLSTWEMYTVAKGATQGLPNMNLFDVSTFDAVQSCIQKKQTDWNYWWSEDEKLCGRIVNSDVYVYKDAKFDVAAQKTKGLKVASFSISSGPSPYHVTCYVPGSAKGQPSSVKLFKYPRLDGTPVANKSFFRCDQVEFKWNNKGTAVLLITSTEVDKTGASYYGEKGLHLMAVNGDSCFVQPPKEGPVYSVEWSPNSTEFCAVHGFMPAKATLFNMKADPIFDFGTGPRNACFYNGHGNLLILAGFGNLRGNMEVWDTKKKKEVCKTQASDTTYLEWSPDGQHVLTSVTAPRLRVGNCYKIWHYSGSLLYENLYKNDEELWEVCWQRLPKDNFPEKPVSYVAVPGIQPSRPEVSKEVYRPPGARGQPSSFDVHADEDGAPLIKPPSNPDVEDSAATKSAKKKKKKKPSRSDVPSWKENSVFESEKKKEVEEASEGAAAKAGADGEDPEKMSKSLLHKKLKQIQKLKEEQNAGKQLHPSQIAKIARETEILDLLNKIKV